MPGESNPRKPVAIKSTESNLVEQVASLQSDVAKLKALISTVALPQDELSDRGGDASGCPFQQNQNDNNRPLDRPFTPVDFSNLSYVDLGVAESLLNDLMNDPSAALIFASEETSNPMALVPVQSPRNIAVGTPIGQSTSSMTRAKFGDFDYDALLAF